MRWVGSFRGSGPSAGLRWIAAALLAGIVVAGWRELWFLTDQAYVPFRYIANRAHGLGYVWNPSPFRPVEGYTSFLWMVLLDAAATLFQVRSPASTTLMSLLFGLATLWQAWRLLLEMSLTPALEPIRGGLAFVALLGIAVNRTFLMSLSSGMESALFSFLVVLWVRMALRAGRQPPGHSLMAVSAVAALAALTRLEGLLLVVATIAIASVAPGPPALRRTARSLAPLTLVAAHAGWRRLFYGEWLPNSYFVDHPAPWPEAGWRYAASFVLEYALWMWLIVAGSALALAARPPRGEGRLRRHAQICVIALAVNVAYVMTILGGDGVEYLAYVHLVPLMFVSFVWAVARLDLGRAAAMGSMATWVALSIPIPWIHHVETRWMSSPKAPFVNGVSLASSFPGILRPYVARFDDLQRWLQPRGVGVRLHVHRTLHEDLRRLFSASVPARNSGAGDPHPVFAAFTPGVAGWALPEVSILDRTGVNDRVIARAPLVPSTERHKRSIRQVPSGYIECHEPNVYLLEGRLTHRTRERPMTRERLATCDRLAELFFDVSGARLLPAAPVRPGSSIDLRTNAERSFDLGPGWSGWESWEGATGGRWTGAVAVATLSRKGREAGLLIDLSCAHPAGTTRGHIEVNGRSVAPVPTGNGRHVVMADVADVPGTVLEVRLVVDSAFVPSERGSGSGDDRQLGVFVHHMRLVREALPDVVEMAAVDDGSPALGAGWWGAEPWLSDVAGRWTAGEAVLRLGTGPGDSALVLDVTFHHPTGITTGGVEIEGRLMARFRRENGRGTLIVGLPAGIGRQVRVNLVADRPYVPGSRRDGTPDRRVLGVFVHAVHVVKRGADDPPYPAAIHPAETLPGAGALPHGWGPIGTQPNGRRGRWTNGEAEVLLTAIGAHGRLVVDMDPGGRRWARGHIEVNGRLFAQYTLGPSGAAITLPVHARSGRFLKVRIITDQISRSASGDEAAWPESGVLVTSVRFEPD